MGYISWDEIYSFKGLKCVIPRMALYDDDLVPWRWRTSPEVIDACREVVYNPKPKKSLEDWL